MKFSIIGFTPAAYFCRILQRLLQNCIDQTNRRILQLCADTGFIPTAPFSKHEYYFSINLNEVKLQVGMLIRGEHRPILCWTRFFQKQKFEEEPSSTKDQPMTGGRKRDYRIFLRSEVLKIKGINRAILQHMSKERIGASSGVFTGTIGSMGLAAIYQHFIDERNEANAQYDKREELLATNFTFNFNPFSDLDCLVKLRFRKKDMIRLLPVFS